MPVAWIELGGQKKFTLVSKKHSQSSLLLESAACLPVLDGQDVIAQ